MSVWSRTRTRELRSRQRAGQAAARRGASDAPFPLLGPDFHLVGAGFGSLAAPGASGLDPAFMHGETSPSGRAATQLAAARRTDRAAIRFGRADVTRKPARIGARTPGGTAGRTALVTTLVIVFVQDYGWSGPPCGARTSLRTTPLPERNLQGVRGRRRGRRLEDRGSADNLVPAGRRRNDQERSVASDAPDREPVETHSITHSTGRDEEKAPHRNSV